MKTKIRRDMIEAGCEDIELIQKWEDQWRAFSLDSCIAEFDLVVKESGRDLRRISQFLVGTYGINKKISAAIALNFANKCTHQSEQKRRLSIGITRARWLSVIGKQQTGKRKICTHEALDGKIFDLKMGLLSYGEYIFPGQAEGCLCIAQPIIPGIDEEAAPIPGVKKRRRRPKNFIFIAVALFILSIIISNFFV